MYTPEEGRRAYLESVEKAWKRPSYAAVLRRVKEEQKAARAMRLMREKANITVCENWLPWPHTMPRKVPSRLQVLEVWRYLCVEVIVP